MVAHAKYKATPFLLGLDLTWHLAMQRRIKYQIMTTALAVLRMYSWNLKVSYQIENKSVSTSWVNLDMQREPKSSWDYVASPRFVFCEPFFFHDTCQRQGFFKGLCVWALIFLCVCVFAWVSLCFFLVFVCVCVFACLSCVSCHELGKIGHQPISLVMRSAAAPLTPGQSG